MGERHRLLQAGGPLGVLDERKIVSVQLANRQITVVGSVGQLGAQQLGAIAQLHVPEQFVGKGQSMTTARAPRLAVTPANPEQYF